MRISWVLAVLTLSFALLAPCSITFAQEDLTAGLSLNDAGAIDLGESLIHPASPLYFLKAIREKIELVLAQNSKVKAQRELEFAQRRLREVKALVKHQRQDLIDSTLERYKASLNEVQNLINHDEELKVTVGEAIGRHLDVLQRVYDQVGNPRAKQAIRAAIERVEEHNRTLLQKLSLVSQQKLIRATASRQALACKFLEREATASGLTDTEKAHLRERVKQCQVNIRENLRDELLELREQRRAR